VRGPFARRKAPGALHPHLVGVPTSPATPARGAGLNRASTFRIIRDTFASVVRQPAAAIDGTAKT
jgi:hypothetical protein